jgi:hypothetical protein
MSYKAKPGCIYFTFGNGQLKNFSIGQDSSRIVLEVEDESHENARLRVFDSPVGDKFCTSYDYKQMQDYFDNYRCSVVTFHQLLGLENKYQQPSDIEMNEENEENEVIDDLIDIINIKGLIIGSRRFGGAIDNSDWDYIISDIWKDKIFHILNETEIDWWMIIPEENSNIYSIYDIKFEYEGIRYNVLIYDDIKFRKLIDNIHLFNTYGSKFGEFLKSNKKARVYIFNGFLQYLFEPELVPFECTEMNRMPSIKHDLNNSNIGL